MEDGVKEERKDEDDPKGDELLTRLIEYYEDSEGASQESRTLCERDRDYVDHKQFTADEIKTLRDRKQPPIVVNRIKPKVDFLLGMERQTRSDPKAFPRTPKHEEAAHAATDAIRYVLDNNTFDYTRSDVFENMLVEGVGGAEVLVKNTKKGPEIVINHYPWDRMFWDMHSRRRDFKDAKYLGAVVWMDREDAEELGNEDAIEAAMSEESSTDTFDDVPRIRWIDKKRNRVKLCSMWFQEKGVWNWAMFTSGGFVQGPEVSPFLDEDGNTECGMEMQSCFVDREGNRYGVVRGLIDIQDEINKRRSKALHLLTMRQTLSEQGAVSDIGMMKAEMAKPDGHVLIQPGMRFEVLNTNDLAQGQLALLQEAKGEIDAIGANASLQGKEERNMSGRALMARQQSGSMELGPVFDSLRSWQKRIYRQVWNRVKQYWKEERWVRVTDDENNLKWVGLNKPITVREQLEQQLGPVPPNMEGDPRLEQVVGMENEIAELDVDIILEDSPDSVTLQIEQFEMLVQMFQANPDAIPFDLIIEASQLRNKQQILERMRSGGATPEEQQAKQQQMQEEKQKQDMMMQVQLDGAASEVHMNQARAQKDTATAEKMGAEAQNKAIENAVAMQLLQGGR